MTPVVRLYWAIALIFMPLSLVWLRGSIDGEVSILAILGAPLQLTVFLVLLAWVLVGAYELFFAEELSDSRQYSLSA